MFKFVTELTIQLPTKPKKTYIMIKYILKKRDSPCFNNGIENDNYFEIKTVDYLNIVKAERIITDNISSFFPGVQYIANEVNMSSTKLKVIFKSVYGTSMLQYLIEKKMVLAMDMLLNSDEQIKNIAMATGHENGSKFSSNFKKQFGKLPSQVRINLI
jgi:AraC-like DNA-binding protein